MTSIKLDVNDTLIVNEYNVLYYTNTNETLVQVL